MAHRSDKSPAFLEPPEGDAILIGRTCTIGRSSANDLVLRNEKISRKHALIHTQDKNEYWLVDFGSSNGTWINGRRVVQPTRLADGDVVRLAGVSLRFRQSQDGPAAREDRFTAGSTSFEARTASCWLLLADIVSSTEMGKKHSEQEVPTIIGRWLFECKQVVEATDGSINKFLGDGFFAYWTDEEGAAARVDEAIRQLKALQGASSFDFRLAVHHGSVSIGGSALMLEELMGRSVNFVFRMEKLAAKLRCACLLSSAAKKRLPAGEGARAMGNHTLAGFDGDFSFFCL